MPPLNFEIYKPATNTWNPIGKIELGDPDGSFSDNHDGQRDVYVFGVDPIENQGYILKSEGGIDEATPEVRKINSLGFQAVARLNPNESYEMSIKSDISPEPRRVKFTYTE